MLNRRRIPDDMLPEPATGVVLLDLIQTPVLNLLALLSHTGMSRAGANINKILIHLGTILLLVIPLLVIRMNDTAKVLRKGNSLGEANDGTHPLLLLY